MQTSYMYLVYYLYMPMVYDLYIQVTIGMDVVLEQCLFIILGMLAVSMWRLELFSGMYYCICINVSPFISIIDFLYCTIWIHSD